MAIAFEHILRRLAGSLLGSVSDFSVKSLSNSVPAGLSCLTCLQKIPQTPHVFLSDFLLANLSHISFGGSSVSSHVPFRFMSDSCDVPLSCFVLFPIPEFLKVRPVFSHLSAQCFFLVSRFPFHSYVFVPFDIFSFVLSSEVFMHEQASLTTVLRHCTETQP